MKTFSYKNIHWHTGNEEAVISCLNLPFSHTVKENRVREVYFCAESPEATARYFVKMAKPERSFRKVKTLFRNKSRSEFQSFELLKAQGIPVVEYVAWGKKGQEGFLITEALYDYQEMSDLFKNSSPLENLKITEAVTDLLIGLINHDLFHPDFHFGNMMGRWQECQMEIRLLDVYGVVRKKSTMKEKFAMLRLVIERFKSLSPLDSKKLFAKISCCLAMDFDQWHPLYLKEVRKEFSTLFRKRVGKLFKKSSFINLEKSESGIFLCYNKEPYHVPFYEKALANHKVAVATQSRAKGWLKTDTKRRVSRYQEGSEHSIVVKEFVKPGRFGRYSADARSWAGKFGTIQYSIPSTIYHAWLKTSDGKAYIFMEDLGDLSFTTAFQQAIVNKDQSNKRMLIHNFARFFANLHCLGIYHRDLKTDNFMVCGEHLKLIDLDDVTYAKNICQRRKIKNLQQAYNTLPTAIGNLEKLQLLAAYKRYGHKSRQEIRTMLEALDL